MRRRRRCSTTTVRSGRGSPGPITSPVASCRKVRSPISAYAGPRLREGRADRGRHRARRCRSAAVGEYHGGRCSQGSGGAARPRSRSRIEPDEPPTSRPRRHRCRRPPGDGPAGPCSRLRGALLDGLGAPPPVSVQPPASSHPGGAPGAADALAGGGSSGPARAAGRRPAAGRGAVDHDRDSGQQPGTGRDRVGRPGRRPARCAPSLSSSSRRCQRVRPGPVPDVGSASSGQPPAASPRGRRCPRRRRRRCGSGRSRSAYPRRAGSGAPGRRSRRPSRPAGRVAVRHQRLAERHVQVHRPRGPPSAARRPPDGGRQSAVRPARSLANVGGCTAPRAEVRWSIVWLAPVPQLDGRSAVSTTSGTRAYSPPPRRPGAGSPPPCRTS